MLLDGKGTEYSEVNMALSAAILLLGNHFEKIKQLFDNLGKPKITDSAFTDLCKIHIYPVIDDWWKCMQETMFNDIGDKPIALSADGSAYSPCFSA